MRRGLVTKADFFQNRFSFEPAISVAIPKDFLSPCIT
jgi:hypothetical protein